MNKDKDLARCGNVIDMDLWVIGRRMDRKTAARDRERRLRRRLKIEARVLPFKPKGASETDETRLKASRAARGPELPQAS